MNSLLVENKELLKSHRDPIWERFLAGILHILTGTGLRKDTIQFWKSHGEVLVEDLENKIPPPSK